LVVPFISPAAYRALAALTRAAPNIDHGPTEMVKVRVSQINGCAYRVDLHAGLAREADVPERTLCLVAVWREAPCFSGPERAALRLAEPLTLLPAGAVPEDAYAEAAEQFPGTLLAELVVVFTGIHAWSRAMLASGVIPALDD
jgi:AhpD family alkylhydroperoxidase